MKKTKVASRALQKQQSRQKILDAASFLFRTKGVTATGIDAIVAKAGLTAGAFYAHFDSKDQLVREATKHSVAQKYNKLKSQYRGAWGPGFLNFYLKLYLSEIHRDHPELGCAVAAYGTEMRRKKHGKQDGWDDQLEAMLSDIQSAFGEVSPRGANRARAIRFFSQAVGCILLSRIVGSNELSKEILKAGQQF